MLHRTALMFLLAAAVAGADDDAPAAVEAKAESTEQAEAASDDDTVSTVTHGNAKYKYTFTLKGVSANVEDIHCHQGRHTGSKKRQHRCVSKETARKEREAAQEFLQEAMRNRGGK